MGHHDAYVLEQPFGGFGRAYQAVCEQCGVLIHVSDRRAAETEARAHAALAHAAMDVPGTPMAADEMADAAHEARRRQSHIESELA